MRGNRPRSHGPTGEAHVGEIIDEPDNCRLAFCGEELLAALAAVGHDHARFVTERNGAAIPIAVGSVPAAVAGGKDRSVVGVFLVYQTDHAAHETAIRVIGDVLDHRHQLDTCSIQLVFSGHLGEQPPRKSGKCVNDDHMHRSVRGCRLRNHPVELSPLEFAPGNVQLLEFLDDFDAFLLAPGATGGALSGA
ncbi:hypothetical protein [Sphingomonas sp. T9W2]|uniref:hypothetical protein n=1 Tax=Sphingomonas sp. T9W2 TaxID=3143183 RepID=UPI0031F5B1A2